MGNVAIAFIELGLTVNAKARENRLRSKERKRIMSLIPRHLCALRNFDTSITTLNLNGLGVDTQILRMLSSSLISGHTRVQELCLEGNQIGSEGAAAVARILSRDRHLKSVSLARNPGELTGYFKMLLRNGVGKRYAASCFLLSCRQRIGMR